MIIRALSVFEGIVYHCYAADATNPCRPTLEVEALVRPGDVDTGPLLVSVADYATMAGGADIVGPCLPKLRRQRRVVEHMGAPYLSFPTWTPVELEHR